MFQDKPRLAPLTRRQLLQAAGGITFLALAPTGDGAFAADTASGRFPANPAPLPIFTALPYLQPGTGSGKLVPGKESLVIAWQTDGTPADFTLEYGPNLARKASVTQTERLASRRPIPQERVINYVATLDALELNRRYQYRVRMNGETLLEGYFTTRKPRGVKTRFVAFGDNSCGAISDHAIAYEAYHARPDFVMNTGDNVYSEGLDSEYAQHFFPVYNADTAGPRTGAPLLRSVPYYSVIANHDISGSDANHRPAADFEKHPDSLAYYTNLHFPSNDFLPSNPTPVFGPTERLDHFRACAGSRFPHQANYTFDYGDAHFLCLDANTYVDPTDAALQAWIAADLDATDAPWKFVVYHHPGFTSGTAHYEEQHMRALAPLFEQRGVDVVLNGHVHNYQRTRPIRFAPSDLSKAKNIHSGDRFIPGRFTVDRVFDGQTHTKPDGVIHIVTGAGGNSLYDYECNETPSAWPRLQDNNADYVARFISDRHSLTQVDVETHALTFTQIDEWGREVDHFRITKS